MRPLPFDGCVAVGGGRGGEGVMSEQVPSKELLPCPFCGFVVRFCSDPTHECHYIVCSGCQAVVDMTLGTDDDIELLDDLRVACAEKWNKRADREPPAKRSKFDLAFEIMRQLQAEDMDTMQSCQFGYVMRVTRERASQPPGDDHANDG
jgi:hypothetical protein